MTTWNNAPSLPNFATLCGLPSACSCASGCTPSTTYQNPFSDADLKTAAVAAVTFPNAGQEQWTGSAVSGYTFGTNPDVSGTATKCIYRFKVHGTEAKQGYQIKWEVWEADPSGVRLYRRETAHFDGNGESVKIVSGGLLDVPSWGGAACQTPGSAIRFVRGESIKVIEE
ncbi:MAG: hypothetical protein HYR88_07215 [Verrucomicrobia bacterium]|nr:hypothetical protein [Verrucomicrobiota bacterium]MBI3868938.1 hypothetical protein [Verrucomicrobiota bacterium]